MQQVPQMQIRRFKRKGTRSRTTDRDTYLKAGNGFFRPRAISQTGTKGPEIAIQQQTVSFRDQLTSSVDDPQLSKGQQLVFQSEAGLPLQVVAQSEVISRIDSQRQNSFSNFPARLFPAEETNQGEKEKAIENVQSSRGQGCLDLARVFPDVS